MRAHHATSRNEYFDRLQHGPCLSGRTPGRLAFIPLYGHLRVTTHDLRGVTKSSTELYFERIRTNICHSCWFLAVRLETDRTTVYIVSTRLRSSAGVQLLAVHVCTYMKIFG